MFLCLNIHCRPVAAPWCWEKERESRAFPVGPRNGILEKTKYTPFFGPLELFFGAWGGKGFGRLLGYYYLFLGHWRSLCLLYIYIFQEGGLPCVFFVVWTIMWLCGICFLSITLIICAVFVATTYNGWSLRIRPSLNFFLMGNAPFFFHFIFWLFFFLLLGSLVLDIYSGIPYSFFPVFSRHAYIFYNWITPHHTIIPL